MHRKIGVWALALAFTATTNAWAAINGSWGQTAATECGGNTFNTCASVTVSLVTSGANAGQVTMTVTNLAGAQGTYDGTVFTQVGMFNLPAGVDYGTLKSVTCTAGCVGSPSDQIANWQLGTSGLSGAGINPVVIGTDTKNGVNGAIATGQTYVFVFTITNFAGITSLDDFAIHGQAGPNSCSTKLVWTGDTPNSPSESPDGTCNFSTVPEPITMTLVGTGLAGMGGMGFFRRRRKSTDLA